MPLPTLSGALEGLKLLDPRDLPRYKAAVEAGQQMGFGYYFPYLLAKNKPGDAAVLISEDDNSLCLFQWSAGDERPRLDVAFPPLPLDLQALQRCLERANDFNGDRSARVIRIDEKDAERVGSLPSLRLELRREQYLFAPDTYENLAGQKYYTIRRNVAAVERLPDVHVVPYVPGHAPACLELLSGWKRAHREAHATSGGAGVSKRAIALAGTLPARDLTGEVVLIDGRVAAYAFGGEIRSGLGCSFERRCDTEVRGLSFFHFRSLLLRLRDFPLVNDGSDAKSAGLRQLKESFRPVAMHREYQAAQRSG